MNWSEITKQYIGTPYEFGSWKKGETLECVSFIAYIMQDQGYAVDLTQRVGGFTKDTYKDITDKNLLNSLLIDWVYNNTDQIGLMQIKHGDIAIVDIKDKDYPGVLDTGNRVILCTESDGIKVFRNLKIKQYRRWRYKL